MIYLPYKQERDFLMIIYKDILNKLKQSGYTTYRLRKEKILSESVLQKIRSKQPISTDTLDILCKLTNSKIEDLIEYTDSEVT